MPARKKRPTVTGDGESPEGSGAMAARQQLGRLLRELRDAAGITQEEAARHIERVPSTVYRMEDGQPGVRIRPGADIDRLCDLYEVADQETRNGLRALAEATRTKGWFQPYLDVIPPKFDMYLGLEGDASELWTYEPERVPGLLQTEKYARALFKVPGPEGNSVDSANVDRLVALRLQRQQAVLRRKTPRPPRLDVVLNEAVLRRPVGGAAVMAAQLRHINQVASELMHVSVRVLPFSAGLHDGMMAGQFIIMRFPNDNQPTRVWMDGLTGHLWFDRPKEVDRYDSMSTNIRKHSLGEERSREMIEQAAEELSNHD